MSQTKRTFTDENGNKFEQDTFFFHDRKEGFIVIKPIPKAVEKKGWRIRMDGYGGSNANHTDLYNKRLKLTDPQAQAIADMLEAVMDYVTGKDFQDGIWRSKEHQRPGDLEVIIDRARAALREEAE